MSSKRSSKTKRCHHGGKKRDQNKHLEAEKGFTVTKTEYHLLKRVLPGLGFSFAKRSLITDFVVPSNGTTTSRLRVERVKKTAAGKPGLHCYRCFKNHPIKGRKGKHVRLEDEKQVTTSAALTFVLGAIEEISAPVPYYSKKRWHFEGVYRGYSVTIALDHTRGLGQYSGYYMEIETILPVGSTDVSEALKAISELAVTLLNEERQTKISYRRMLMRSWATGKTSKKKLRRAAGTYRKLFKQISAAEKG